MRKLVRTGLIGLVSLQIITLGLISTPKANAIFGIGDIVFDPAVFVRAGFDYVKSRARNILLDRTKGIAEQHLKGINRYGGYVTGAFDVDGVSQRPVEHAMSHQAHRVVIPASGPLGQERTTHLGYTNQNASNDMLELMPANRAWTNYQTEYLASAEGASQTLRGSVAALNEIHREMQQDNTRFTSLRRQAGRVDSDIAMAQVQVEGQLELARQIQRANAINSVQTNIYAIVENQRISTEARSVAKRKRNGCEITAMLSGAAVGGIAGDIVGQTIHAGCR